MFYSQELDENVDYEERESEFDLEDEDKSVQMNEEEKDGDDVEVSLVYVVTRSYVEHYSLHILISILTQIQIIVIHNFRLSFRSTFPTTPRSPRSAPPTRKTKTPNPCSIFPSLQR